MCVSSIFWLWRDRRRRWWFQRAGAAIAFNDLLFTRRLHHSLSTVLPLIEDVTTLLNARHERTFSVSLTFSFRGRNFTFILAICCCHSGYCIFSKLTNERNHLVINVRNRLFFVEKCGSTTSSSSITMAHISRFRPFSAPFFFLSSRFDDLLATKKFRVFR